jgi:hypothetical protein
MCSAIVDCACEPIPCSFQTCTWSGACSYDGSTCAFTAGGTIDCGEGPGSTCSGPWPYVFDTAIDTSTTRTYSSSTGGSCARNGACTGYPAEISGSSQETLSNEDTPSDVLARGTTTSGTNNCAWGIIVDYTGAGCPGGQYGVSKQSSDWTLSFTGLVIGCKYTVVITFTSTPGGTTTETHTFTADATTDTLTGTIPQTDGVKTCWTSYVVTAGDP